MAKKILIVDDSEAIRKSVQFVLEQAGFESEQAGDGEEGVTVFSSGKFDLILTDINMPKMNGFELTEKVRALPAGKFVPILILTTESQGSMIEKGKKAGATGWIVKPFSNEKLLETVQKVIG